MSRPRSRALTPRPAIPDPAFPDQGAASDVSRLTAERAQHESQWGRVQGLPAVRLFLADGEHNDGDWHQKFTSLVH